VAGALAEMKINILSKDYPELNWNGLNIYLIRRLILSVERHVEGIL